MPLQEIECMGAQLGVALQVCLEHEGVDALGGGEGPTSTCGTVLFWIQDTGFCTATGRERHLSVSPSV